MGTVALAGACGGLAYALTRVCLEMHGRLKLGTTPDHVAGVIIHLVSLHIVVFHFDFFFTSFFSLPRSIRQMKRKKPKPKPSAAKFAQKSTILQTASPAICAGLTRSVKNACKIRSTSASAQHRRGAARLRQYHQVKLHLIASQGAENRFLLHVPQIYHRMLLFLRLLINVQKTVRKSNGT